MATVVESCGWVDLITENGAASSKASDSLTKTSFASEAASYPASSEVHQAFVPWSLFEQKAKKEEKKENIWIKHHVKKSLFKS